MVHLICPSHSRTVPFYVEVILLRLFTLRYFGFVCESVGVSAVSPLQTVYRCWEVSGRWHVVY